MARTPDLVEISLQDLMLLLCYKWAAVNSKNVGDLGVTCYEDFVSQLGIQSNVRISPMQLADLIHHMKEVVFEGVQPAPLAFTAKNYNMVMRRLKRQQPDLFKELSSGEVVMHELEERVIFGEKL